MYIVPSEPTSPTGMPNTSPTLVWHVLPTEPEETAEAQSKEVCVERLVDFILQSVNQQSVIY
jgi:hypothetical protein